ARCRKSLPVPPRRAHGRPRHRCRDFVAHSPGTCGGNLNAHGAPAFPNARYVMLRAEWEYWMSDRPIAAPPSDEAREARMRAAARTNLSAVQAQLDLVDPEIEILEGISTVPAFGHTPGHMALDIASNGERLLFAGDAIIDPIDVEHPESVSVFDHQLEYVMATRLRLLDKAAREKALVSTSHCPFPGLAY